MEMIHGDQRQTASPCEGGGKTHAHQKGADKTGAGGHGDQFDLARRRGERAFDENRKRLEMLARSELGHHSAVGCVRRDLARELVRLEPSIGVEDGHGGLVTRGLDGKGAEEGP